MHEIFSGGDLLSRGLAPRVPSALEGLTSVFGMGTGVAPPLDPPEIWRSDVGCQINGKGFKYLKKSLFFFRHSDIRILTSVLSRLHSGIFRFRNKSSTD